MTDVLLLSVLSRIPFTLCGLQQKVIQQSKTLPTSTDLEELIYCAEGASSEEEFEETLTSGSFNFCPVGTFFFKKLVIVIGYGKAFSV